MYFRPIYGSWNCSKQISFQMNKIVSSIDIGTNTITLLIAKIHKNKISSLYHSEHIASLGEGLVKNNQIKSSSIKRCVKYLLEFKKEIKKYNVKKEFCVATSALRQAKNKNFVLSQFHKINVFPKIISGNDEAKYIGNIVLHEFPNDIKNTLVVDIGGGSTELIHLYNSKIINVDSLNIGSVTLFEMFFSDPIKDKNLTSSKHFLLKLLNNSFLKNNSFSSIIGVGGTITSLSAIYNNIIPYNPNLVHKSSISINSFDFFIHEFFNKTIHERSLHPLLEQKRARVIPAGFFIFKEIMNYNNFKSLLVCEKGLRWGVILNKKS